MYVYMYIYIYIIYCNSEKAISANCLNVGDSLLQCKKDSQGVITNT